MPDETRPSSFAQLQSFQDDELTSTFSDAVTHDFKPLGGVEPRVLDTDEFHTLVFHAKKNLPEAQAQLRAMVNVMSDAQSDYYNGQSPAWMDHATLTAYRDPAGEPALVLAANEHDLLIPVNAFGVYRVPAGHVMAEYPLPDDRSAFRVWPASRWQEQVANSQLSETDDPVMFRLAHKEKLMADIKSAPSVIDSANETKQKSDTEMANEHHQDSTPEVLTADKLKVIARDPNKLRELQNTLTNADLPPDCLYTDEHDTVYLFVTQDKTLSHDGKTLVLPKGAVLQQNSDGALKLHNPIKNQQERLQEQVTPNTQAKFRNLDKVSNPQSKSNTKDENTIVAEQAETQAQNTTAQNPDSQQKKEELVPTQMMRGGGSLSLSLFGAGGLFQKMKSKADADPQKFATALQSLASCKDPNALVIEGAKSITQNGRTFLASVSDYRSKLNDCGIPAVPVDQLNPTQCETVCRDPDLVACQHRVSQAAQAFDAALDPALLYQGATLAEKKLLNKDAMKALSDAHTTVGVVQEEVNGPSRDLPLMDKVSEKLEALSQFLKDISGKLAVFAKQITSLFKMGKQTSPAPQ